MIHVNIQTLQMWSQLYAHLLNKKNKYIIVLHCPSKLD